MTALEAAMESPAAEGQFAPSDLTRKGPYPGYVAAARLATCSYSWATGWPRWGP
jgi:hypothetical protein